MMKIYEKKKNELGTFQNKKKKQNISIIYHIASNKTIRGRHANRLLNISCLF